MVKLIILLILIILFVSFSSYISTVCPERIFEDHENLVENLLNWTRDSTNRLMFIERIEKYALFKNPQVRGTDFNISTRAIHLFRSTTVPVVVCVPTECITLDAIKYKIQTGFRLWLIRPKML